MYNLINLIIMSYFAVIDSRTSPIIQHSSSQILRVRSGDRPSHLRLLIVDDAVLVRKFHRRILAPSFEEILEANNGLQAVDRVNESILTNKPIHGILMDNSMPFMDGTTATQLIRQLGYNGKVFGITGNAFQSDIDDFLAHGVDEVLIKPVSLEKYAHIVEMIS